MSKPKSEFTPQDVLQLIAEKEIRYVDFRFTDTIGKEQHMTIPARELDFKAGKPMDGSSIQGWRGIDESDLVLSPDPTTAMLDPFMDDPTLILRCDIRDPKTGVGYERDPRSVAKRAEAYLNSTGIAHHCYVGPEPEFFIFDSVQWENSMSGAFYRLDSREASWNSGRHYEEGNFGHRPNVKGGYFPVPPVDATHNIRASMCNVAEEMGLPVEVHHHEVATAGQCEIGIKFNTLLIKSDELMTFKQIVHNVAHAYGKTATFMPKPLVGDNGSGMHCHISLFRDGENIFAGDKYAGLSDTALYFIGGIIHHARSLNAFTNPGTNSYKRLVPGFEAPVLLAYSACNRSAAIRIPYSESAKGRRIEVRFPDPTANPYFAFSAMLMAGLDGIKNKMHPGDAMDKDLYDLPPEELKDIPTVCASLEQALDSLMADCDYLLQGDVFSKDLLMAYVQLKRKEIQRLRATTHPIEFELYYSL